MVLKMLKGKTLDFWNFIPFLKGWGITYLDKETVVTEFYELVFK